MAKEKTQQKKTEEKEFVIPLRKEWRKVANYRRAGRAAKFIKKFIARHMKIPEHDVSKVKIDQYLNNEIWFRGKMKPPARIKVKAIKLDDIVRVELAELPEEVKFLKQKHEKRHKESEKKEEPKPEEKKEEVSEEKKKEESEKSKSVAEQRTKQAEAQAKAEKHTIQKKEPKIHRMALKK